MFLLSSLIQQQSFPTFLQWCFELVSFGLNFLEKAGEGLSYKTLLFQGSLCFNDDGSAVSWYIDHKYWFWKKCSCILRKSLINRGWLYRIRIIGVTIFKWPGSTVYLLFNIGWVLISFNVFREAKISHEKFGLFDLCRGVLIMIAPSYDWMWCQSSYPKMLWQLRGDSN